MYKERIDTIYPSYGFVKELDTSSLKNQTQVQALFDTDPKLNLRKLSVDTYIRDNKLELSSEAVSELKLVQRVQSYSNNVELGNQLLNKKLHSAPQIYSKGQEGFVNEMKTAGVEVEEANKVFEKAAINYTKMVAFMSEFSSQFNENDPQAVGNPCLLYTSPSPRDA